MKFEVSQKIPRLIVASLWIQTMIRYSIVNAPHVNAATSVSINANGTNKAGVGKSFYQQQITFLSGSRFHSFVFPIPWCSRGMFALHSPVVLCDTTESWFCSNSEERKQIPGATCKSVWAFSSLGRYEIDHVQGCQQSVPKSIWLCERTACSSAGASVSHFHYFLWPQIIIIGLW